jgi:hypothetical protein
MKAFYRPVAGRNGICSYLLMPHAHYKTRLAFESKDPKLKEERTTGTFHLLLLLTFLIKVTERYESTD